LDKDESAERGTESGRRGLSDPEPSRRHRPTLDRAAFRRDPLLRSSAHHLATWSLSVLVLDLRDCAGATSSGATGGAPMFVVVAVLAGAILASLTHERRLGKMLGPAPDPPGRPTAGQCRVAAMLATVVGILTLTSLTDCTLATVWMGCVGVGLFAWGRALAFRPYVRMGSMLALLAGVDALLGGGEASWILRAVALGILVPAGAMTVNRR